ncbi:potassium channel family protein [Salinispirillum marinum]|uniref:Potassium channel family protein n=2 Tax=Saccharospirillaceae TaxID=255527 RepID=A0ABV8BBK3_9GAMM
MAKNRIAVIGLGRFGATLAEEAQKNGLEVLVVDKNEQKVNDMADEVSEAIIADCTNPRAIKAIDWLQFKTVVVAIGSDIKNSLMTVINLQEAGVTNLWCKVQDRYHAALITRLGVQKVISPEEEMGRRAGRTLRHPDMAQQMQLNDAQYVAEIDIYQRTSRSDFMRAVKRQGMNLLAVSRKHNGHYEPLLEAPECLYPGDKVLLLSTTGEGFAWPSLMSSPA